VRATTQKSLLMTPHMRIYTRVVCRSKETKNLFFFLNIPHNPPPTPFSSSALSPYALVIVAPLTPSEKRRETWRGLDCGLMWPFLKERTRWHLGVVRSLRRRRSGGGSDDGDTLSLSRYKGKPKKGES